MAFGGRSMASILICVAAYGPEDVARLLADAGMVRNRQKIEATIGNARSWHRVQQEIHSFSDFLWSFVGGEPRRHAEGYTPETLPAKSAESDAMSKELRRRGFRFVGSTICYAFMQGSGLVDDHVARLLSLHAARWRMRPPGKPC